MKKSIVIILTLVLVFSLSACNKPSMQLTNANLTVEELKILELMQLQTMLMPPVFFDYVVDETVKSITITSYELDENGQWEKLMSDDISIDNVNKGRIALSFGLIPNGIRTDIQAENGRIITSNTIDEEIAAMSRRGGVSFGGYPTEIVCEQEIPLLFQVIAKGVPFSFEPEYFFQPPKRYLDDGYEHVYAITVTFSQKPLS